MDDGDGLKVSSSNEVDTGSAVSSADQEDVDPSKTPFAMDSGFSNSTQSHSLKMLLNYNSVNGDCAEKDVIQSEHSIVASSSNNSLFSESTRDSLRRESESSSDYSSKSSESDISEVKKNFSFPKSNDNSSPLHHSPSFGSDSSSESDEMSESEEEEDDNSKDRDDRIETPDERVVSPDERIETPDEQIDQPDERAGTPYSQSSHNFEVDTPKRLLLSIHRGDKENESGDTSQSDDSFKKEEDSHPEEPDKKDTSLDISQSSDDSTVDSERTIGHSLTSSMSQDISLPQDATNSSTPLNDKVDSITSEVAKNPQDETKETERMATFTGNTLVNENTQEEKFLHSSVPEETSNSSFGAGGSSEENNTNSSTGEIKEIPPLQIESFKSDLKKDSENNSGIKEGEVASHISLPSASDEKEQEQIQTIEPCENNQDAEKESPSSVKSNYDQCLCFVENREVNEVPPSFTTAESTTFKLLKFSINSKNNNDDIELSKEANNFSIKYKGFKKIGCALNPKSLKKCFLRWNPFNPARKKDPKTGKYKLVSVPEDHDSSSLQPEYAQYLGLQPIVKFKCSYCGMSTFQSMSALNAHKVDCKRNVTKPQFSAVDNNKAITIRRRVFMCSVCGSYKPRSEVFQHMLEVHKSYVCLFDKCLHICQSPDALLHHIHTDHQVEQKYCQSLEDFQKEMTNNFYVFCVSCQKVFTELDDPSNHSCSLKSIPRAEVISNINEPDKNFTSITRIPSSAPSEVNPSQKWDFAKVTASLKLNKDITMKPVQDVQVSDSCQFRTTSTQDIFNNKSFDNSPNKIENFASEIISKPPSENLNIKVPNDIEIKPLIPGEIHNQENKFEPTNNSTIEIFPIPPTQPQKSIKKTRTIVKKTIRKKKIIVGKKKKNVENLLLSNDLHPIPEEMTAPPLSPPIIAPPPIVHSPEPVPLATDITPMVIDPEPSEPTPVPAEQTEFKDTTTLHSVEEEKPPSPDNDEFQLNLSERNEVSEIKRSIPQDIFKIKLQDSDNESDDSQKLSLVVDENTNNSEDFPSKKDDVSEKEENNELSSSEGCKADPNDIPLASEDVAAMALTLDDKIENVPIQAVVKECVRTSCMSCNYCRHAVKIAVNGKQLALHLLSEHRYTPVKNETNDDVIRKLKGSLDALQTMHFNAETYDSSDRSIHIPYDKESNFDCFQCSYVSASHKDLYAHKRKFHTKSLLLCIMCKKNFFSYSELICHICTGTYCADPLIYSVDINFRCCFCRLDTIPSAFRLMVHLRKSHHTCDICLEICTDQQKLSTHMWKHKLNHLCYRCGIAYASKPDITKHLFWKHGTESVLCKKCLQKKWPHVYHFCIPPTSFICEECNTSFSKAVALKVHKRIHGNDYPYSCTQCEKKFVSKKLLSRHIDRHNAILQKKDLANKSPDETKEEIINVTDVDNKDVFHNENSDSNKEGDSKDKSHKKHKKEKDKKDKKVLDVYDLPPLNLSSESDSSDEDSPHKPPTKGLAVENPTVISSPNKMDGLRSENKGPDMPKLDGMLEGEDKSMESSNFLNLLKQDESGDELSSERKPTASEPVSPLDSSVVNSLLPMGKDEIKNDPIDPMQNDHSFMNWENFYKTNSLNSNLPFPLCAMKSEVAYSIIMGDHDYCQQQFKTEPIIKEEWPSTSNQHLSDDKLEEVTPLLPEKPRTPPPVNTEGENISTPTKKKLKSPKKKVNKTPDDKNSSSSSDSSSDSDSSCSCATNCSCSSSSDSSTSSSSDSDSSTNDDKKDKRRKKKDKKLPIKPDERESETIKEMPRPEPEEEITPLPEPEDPPIRESELETDESTSDEEFYDRQPQIIANQLLAEKREKQISLTTPVNNGNASPLPVTPGPQQLTPTPPPTPVQPLLPQIPPIPSIQENIPPVEQAISVETPKLKPRTKRKRRVATPRTPKIEKPLPEPSFPKYSKESKPSPFGLFQQTPVVRHKLMTPILGRSPSLPEASGSGSETDNTRLSKRRRVPNKFYGYSSGEEEEKSSTPKWRKVETPTHHIPLPTHHTPKLPSTITHPPPTPRIQLTVPKQTIRRPYQKQSSKQKIPTHRPVSSDSTDSGSDIDDRIPRPPSPIEPPKSEKDVYCYCRCPYDEVSEMIACDDINCKIEWFHFECVGILVPPRGQWYCPDCRKARGLPT